MRGALGFDQVVFAETGMIHDLHVGQEVTILGISLYALGLGERDTFHLFWLATPAHKLAGTRFRSPPCRSALGGAWSESYLPGSLFSIFCHVFPSRVRSSHMYVSRLAAVDALF
jgi:hypothetical protein